MNRTIFIALAVAFGLAVISLATFMGLDTGPSLKFNIKQDEGTILFGVTPWGEPRQVREAYRPLLDYLGEKTGKRFQLLIMEDYEVAVDNVVDGSIDISVISPVCYVRAKGREPGIQYIFTIAREQGGKLAATFKGHLVTLRSKSSNMTLEDFIRNAEKYNFAFVTKSSASGFAYPMAMFKKLDLDPDKIFKSVTIFENHPAMTDAMVAGKIDLGATWEYNLEKARERHGDVFKIVYTTSDIPGLSWVTSKKVDAAFVEKLRQTLMEISASKELREKLLKDTPDKGWIAVDQNVYDEVREVMKYAGEFK